MSFAILPLKMEIQSRYLAELSYEFPESVRNSTALAASDAWKGTSREELYEESGWESLSLRCWSRRLVFFNKIVNDITPDYTRCPMRTVIPQLKQSIYSFRNADTAGQMRARATKFNTSLVYCLSESIHD